MMQLETVLSTRRIYEGRVINLRVDDVRTSNGVNTLREIVEHPGAVAIVAVDDEDRILLVRQYRHAAGRVMTEIPAGTLEPGEDPLSCAARELDEETGYIAAHIDRLGGVYTSPGFCTEYIHLFVATGLTRGTAHPEEDEQIGIDAIPRAEVMRRVLAGEIEDAKSVSALLLFDHLAKAREMDRREVE
jgi:ADP-ribose pyrophosphatase